MGPFKERNNRLRGYHRIKSYEPLLCKRRQHFLTEGVALMAITMFTNFFDQLIYWIFGF